MLAIFSFSSCEDDEPTPPNEEEVIDISKIPLPATHKVDFEKEIYPLFKEKCFSINYLQQMLQLARKATKN